MADGFWDEHIPDEEELQEIYDAQGDYQELVKKEKERLKHKARQDKINEVGKVPPLPQEILDDRAKYSAPGGYNLIHQDLFPNSTGIKPLGPYQRKSVEHSQYFVQEGTHIVKCEPRGMGKTSRSTNEGLYGVLEGSIKYLVIVASNTNKAEEIITSVMAELMTNEELFRLYPATLKCFRHTEKNPRKSLTQTYDGEPTYLYYNNGFIVFPYIDGEPSSGAIIDIRARKNVRGIYHTVEAGENAGTRQRPTHVILDDIQTDEEAENPKTAEKIVNLIKKSIMRAGGHDSGLSIMMNGTPIAPGDVTHHFLFNEPWQHMIYQMLPKRSDREDLWFGEYKDILLDFDKTVPGAMLAAQERACKFYEERMEVMNEGAEVAWDWCYLWNTKTKVEVHAVQHAYNIMILEGMDVFESECQCNVEGTETDESITYCTAEEIRNSIHARPRYNCQLKDRHVVTHVDVNKPFLTYMTVSSPDIIQPQILDYDTFPTYRSYPEKTKAPYGLKEYFEKEHGCKLIPEDITYYAVRHIINVLTSRRYPREDGAEFPNHYILIDSRYHSDWVYKAIRDSKQPNVHPIQGQKFGAKEKSIAQMRYSDAAKKFHHCVLVPTDDRTLFRLTNDIYYMMTQAHICFSRPADSAGAASLFLPPEDANTDLYHRIIGKHFRAEKPKKEVCPKTGKEVTIWEPVQGSPDNEYFDNFVGCMAGLSMRGVKFKVQSEINNEAMDINDYFNR